MTTLRDLERLEAARTQGEWEWYNGCSWWRLGIKDDQTRHDAVIRPHTDSDGQPNMYAREADKAWIEACSSISRRLLRFVQAYDSWQKSPNWPNNKEQVEMLAARAALDEEK